MNILISAANSDISTAIARIMQLNYPEASLVGVAPDGLWPGNHFYKNIESVPFIGPDNEYIIRINNIIKKYDIDLFIPISEKELAFFASPDAPKVDVDMLINPKEVIETCLDKYKTYLWLKEIGISVPETYLFNDQKSFEWPVVVKPRKSAGSKNIFTAKNKIFLNAIRQEYSDIIDQYIIQRQISDATQEYTCALWRQKNDFRFLILHRKLQGGLTSEAKVVRNISIEDTLNKIQKNIFGDFFINVQLRLENGVPYVFEINPRFSSTVIMRHKIGFQDLVWSINAKLHLSISSYSGTKTGTQIYRLSDELIV